MNPLQIQSAQIPAEITRISVFIIDQSIISIKTQNKDNDTLIHELRKSVKNLRALLKLLRKEIGEDLYKIYNYSLRDINRKSASARNYSALIKLTETILNYKQDTYFPDSFKLILEKLKFDFETAREKIDYKNLFNFNISHLENHKSMLGNLNITGNRFSFIKNGLVKIYHDGKYCLNKNLKTTNDTELHEWRKNVKDLYYCLLSLLPLWKPILKAYIKEFKILSEILGDIHDLFELQKYASSLKFNPADMLKLNDLLENKQYKLIKRSLRYGTKIFAENEKTFGDRIKSYYNSFKRETKTQNSFHHQTSLS